MAKRCLVISYYFPPSGGGGVQRILKMVKYLSQTDWVFHVITAIEDVSYLPTDDSLSKELPDSTTVQRIGMVMRTGRLRIRSSFLVRWLVSLFYIPDIRRRWIKKVKPVIVKTIDEGQFDLIFITIPPYSLALLAGELSKETSIPIILDMRDAWSRDPLKIYPTPFHQFYDRYLEKRSLASIRTIISVYQGTIRYLQSRLNNPAQKFFHIPNGYDEEDFHQLCPQTLEADCFHMALSGTLYSHLNRPDLLFKAFREIKKHRPEIYQQLRFHYVGRAQIKLEKIIARYECDDIVQVWGYKSHQECLNILAAAHAFCIIFDSKIKYAGNVIGGKVYEYLALKKPILALVPESGETAELIHATQSGEVIDLHRTQRIAEILIDWIENRDFSKYTFRDIGKYSRKAQAFLFRDIFEKTIIRK